MVFGSWQNQTNLYYCLLTARGPAAAARTSPFAIGCADHHQPIGGAVPSKCQFPFRISSQNNILCKQSSTTRPPAPIASPAKASNTDPSLLPFSIPCASNGGYAASPATSALVAPDLNPPSLTAKGRFARQPTQSLGDDRCLTNLRRMATHLSRR